MSRTPFAALACAGFFVEGALAVAHRELAFTGTAYNHLLDAGYAAAMVGCALAVPAVASVLAVRPFGRIGARVASAGFAAMALESAVAVVHRLDALGPLFVLGIAAAVLGCLLLALAGRVGQRPPAALPLAAMVLAASGGEVGASLLSAAAWGLLVRVLQRAERPSPSPVAVPQAS